MPAVSQAQRKAMFAAKAGHSTLGIPQKVGAEFADADPGGKLSARAPSAKPSLGPTAPVAKESMKRKAFTGMKKTF